MTNKAYKIIMSSGDPIQVDADELGNVLAGIQHGAIVACRRGIFNPSFYVSITEDRDRTQEFREELRLLHDEEHERKRIVGPEKLKDLFKDIALLGESKHAKLN